MQLMTLHQIAERSGHSLDALQQRRHRGRLGIEPVDNISGTYVYAKDEAEHWIKHNQKEEE